MALGLCLLVVTAVAAQDNGQKVYPWGSPEHDTLLWLALEAGVAPPSGTGPFSAAEMEMELSRISRADLTAVGRERWEWLADRLSYRSERERADVVLDSLTFSAGLELNLETYLDVSDDVTSWERPHRRRLPFLSVPLEAWAGEHAYGILDLDFRKFPPVPGGEPTSEPDPWTNVVFTDLNSLDIEFPSRAFLSVGGDFWNLQFGRDDVNWGSGHTGNMFIGDSVREYDFARLNAFWEVFKFSTIWMSMDGRLSPAERDALAEGEVTIEVPADTDGDGDIDSDDGTETIVVGNDSKYADITDIHRSFIAHRFEVRLWDRINLIATEGIIYGGQDLDMRYLNPLMLYHNHYTNPFPGNVHMSYEIEATITPGLMAYVQLSPDQWSAPLEQGDYTANEPNALGYLAGIRWQQPTERGYVRTIAEAAYLDPWMYIHDRGHTSLSYRDLLTTESFATNGNRAWVEAPLGYYTGNDSSVMFLEGRYVRPGAWFAGLRGRVEVRGERDMTDTLPVGDNESDLTEDENRARTPSGDHPEWTTFVTVFGEIETATLAPRLGETVFGVEATWATVTNRGNVQRATAHDAQLVLYARLYR